jgi:spermidine synthase
MSRVAGESAHLSGGRLLPPPTCAHVYRGSVSAPAPRLNLDVDEKLVVAGLVVLVALRWTPSGVLPPIEAVHATLAATFVLLVPLLAATIRSGTSRALPALRRCAPVVATVFVCEGITSAPGNRITRWLGLPPHYFWERHDDPALFGALLVAMLALVLAEFVLVDAELVLRLRRALVLALFAALFLRTLVSPGPWWAAFPALDAALVAIVLVVMWPRLGARLRAVAVFAAAAVAVAVGGPRRHVVDLIAGAAIAVAAVQARGRLGSGARVDAPLEAGAIEGRPDAPRARRLLQVLALLFVSTGAAALLSEQAFEKLLGSMLGASTPAAAVVLAVYFVGLTGGAGLYGLASRRIVRPLAAYALLEAGVAAWALFLCIDYEELTRWSEPILVRAAGSSLTLEAARIAIACAWMLPPTLFMGASFPAMVDTLEAMRAPSPRRTMSTFYALNLLGAVAGAVAGPYLAFPRWGVDGTLLAAATIDAAACLAALALDLATRWTKPPSVRVAAAPASQREAAPLVVAAFLSGFLLFSLEVLWTHLLSATIGNSVYSFAAMLALVLMGLFAGSAISARAFRGADTTPTWVLAAACVVGGLVLALQEPRWPSIPARLAIAGPDITTFVASECLRWFHAGVQILPAATVLGLLYPTLFRLREFPNAGRARLLGGLAATNAAGCCTGALLTAFVAIPRLGSQRSIDLIAIACSALGGALAAAFSTGRLRRALIVTAASVAAFTIALPRWNRLALTAGTHVYLRPAFVFPDTELAFFHEDSFGGITTVVDNSTTAGGNRGRYRTLLTNGKFQGNDAGETAAQVGFAVLPILHAHGFERACVIGLGTGQSARVFSDLGFASVDVAEISPGIVAASPYFAEINGHLLQRPRVHLWLEDGRSLLSLQPELACDVVSMEISSVWFAGSTNLYSREFYAIARQRLGDRGILQQWIQVHHIGMEELATVLASVRAVFPHVSFWVFGDQGIIVASPSPLELSTVGATRFFEGAGALGFDPVQARRLFVAALASRLLSDADVTRLSGEPAVLLNTDRNRHLEYATARYAVNTTDLAAKNIEALGRGARFTPLEMASDYPADYRALVEDADAKRHAGRDAAPSAP